MTDDIEPPGDIDTIDELTAYLDTLAEAHNDLRRDVERIDNQVIRALDRTKESDSTLKSLSQDVDRLRDDLDLVNSTMPDQQRGKLEKVRAIVEFGINDATGGRSGAKVKTGQAAAAASASRDTARRLMDEIGANFSWARTETPGGPNPKELILNFDGRETDDLIDDVRQHFEAGATA